MDPRPLPFRDVTTCSTIENLHSEFAPALDRRPVSLNSDDVYVPPHLVVLPPLPEQRAIAAVLDAIDDAIERAEAVVAATERLRDALLHELLTRGVPGWHSAWRDVPGVGVVPASWEVVRLGEVAQVNPKRPRLNVTNDTRVSFLPMAAVGEQLSGIIECHDRYYQEMATGYTYFEEGDVLFAKITPCLQNGKHVLVHTLTHGFGFGSTEFHVIRAGSRLDEGYLFRAVTQPHNLTECANSFTGTAGQQRVQPETLRALRLPLPSLPEQRAIVAMLDGVDEAIEWDRNETSVLRSLKASAADALLTGRVRVGL